MFEEQFQIGYKYVLKFNEIFLHIQTLINSKADTKEKGLLQILWDFYIQANTVEPNAKKIVIQKSIPIKELYPEQFNYNGHTKNKDSVNKFIVKLITQVCDDLNILINSNFIIIWMILDLFDQRRLSPFKFNLYYDDKINLFKVTYDWKLIIYELVKITYDSATSFFEFPFSNITKYTNLYAGEDNITQEQSINTFSLKSIIIKSCASFANQ